jgi:pantothenate kinase
MAHEATPPNLDRQIACVLEAIQARHDVYLIAVVGIPGSGKSTFCNSLVKRLPGSIVLPMDGYHLCRSQLSAGEMKRRGAPHTFDSDKLRKDLINLRQTRTGSFPAFDHAKKDPEPDAIQVGPADRPIIVEGNYLLLSTWGLQDLFDLQIFIECDIHRAMDRVRDRLVQCKITETAEEAAQQVRSNDLANAYLILTDGAKARADLVLQQE